MQVIVTGSRDLTDQDLVWDALSELFILLIEEFTVVHGGARGADTFAGQWVKMMRPHFRVFEDKHEADWKTHGKAAGVLRNAEMVDAGADYVLAFYREGSANIGTRDCVRRARAAGIPVIEYTQEA